MRKEIYKAIHRRLRAAFGDEIKHINLWNHNVEFIENEIPWECPAVFIEFNPIRWHTTGFNTGQGFRGMGSVSLHIVTQWSGSPMADGGLNEEELATFEWSRRIHAALSDLSGEGFHSFEINSTHTNHNHEELVENIDVYNVIYTRMIEKT